jgi:hypothetical protein
VEIKHAEIVLIVCFHWTVFGIFGRLLSCPQCSRSEVKVKVVGGASKLCEFLQKGGQAPVYLESVATGSVILHATTTLIALIGWVILIVIVVIEAAERPTARHLLFVALRTILAREVVACASLARLSTQRNAGNLSDVNGDQLGPLHFARYIADVNTKTVSGRSRGKRQKVL